MNEYSQLIKHPDISLSPISDGIGVGNPATGEILAYVRNTGSDKLKNLIQKAAAAQKLWAAKTALERADILWRWYFLVKENKEALARLMTMEQGKKPDRGARRNRLCGFVCALVCRRGAAD